MFNSYVTHAYLWVNMVQVQCGHSGPLIHLVQMRTITWIYYILLLVLQFGQLCETWLSQGKYIGPSVV